MWRRGVTSSSGSGPCAWRAIGSPGSTMSFTGEVWAIATRPSSSSMWARRDRRTRCRGSPSEAGSSRDAWIKEGRRKPAGSRGASIKDGRSPSGANRGAWNPDEPTPAGVIRSESSQTGPVACRRGECSRRPSSRVQVLKRLLIQRRGGLSPGVPHAWRLLPRHQDGRPYSDGSPECFRGWAMAVMLVPMVNAVVRADRPSPSPLPPLTPRLPP